MPGRAVRAVTGPAGQAAAPQWPGSGAAGGMAASRAFYVAVADPASDADTDPAASRRAENRAIQRRLTDSAWVSVLAQLPALGRLLMAFVVLSVAAAVGIGGDAAATAIWAVASMVVATATVWLPRQRRVLPPAARIALAGAWACCAAAPPAWAAPALAPLLACQAIALGLTGAVLLAPIPAAAAAAIAVPFATCVAAAHGSDLAAAWWWVGGGFASASAAAVAGLRMRAWRRAERARIHLDEQLRRAESERDDAQRSDQEKSRFLAIASHDLRQPVHALGLFAATLQKRLRDSPEEPLARNLMSAVDGLERSFNALLDVSRLDAGALPPRLQTFPLRDVFRRLHMQYAGQAELAGLALRFSPGGKSILSDPQLLERMLGNLVQNAIKYTTRGGVVVVARSTRNHTNVEVWDTGCGVTAAELPRIFDEYYQVGGGERDRAHGLGMGLAIVKRLAALLRHRLEVASVPGRGTMFRIGVRVGGLPGIQEDLAPADTMPMPMPVQTPQMILVVDDEEPIREGLRLLLQEWGYQTMTAADATQAEQAVAALEGHVDLVLSDLQLGPGGDGVELIAAIRRLCGREIPALLVTGDTTHVAMQRLTGAGDPVLFKPVQPRLLYEALRTALE